MTSTEATTQSLVQAVEVWRPNQAGERLEWCSGCYGDRPDAADQRRSRTWGFGEGVAGRAWEQRTVLIERNLDGSLTGDVEPLGASHVVAIPSFQGEVCRGVTLLIGEEDGDRQGAFELWRPNERGELALSESWYASLERFGLVSNYVKFPRRAGLPGRIWADRFPRVMGSLGTSRDFVRVAGAKADGLSTALGIPFMKSALDLESVFVLLSSSRSPIARVMEVWAVDPETKLANDAEALRIVSADYGPYVDLAPACRKLRLPIGEGIAGRVYREGAPWATHDLTGIEYARGERFSSYGFERGLGIPVFAGDALYAVVILIQ